MPAPAVYSTLNGMTISTIDWKRAAASLNAEGYATLPALLNPEECQTLVGMYKEESLFRSRVDMARHGFGRGEYQYFRYPLPEQINQLRTFIYGELAAIANGWNAGMGIETRFPQKHAAFLEKCHHAGQTRPTPLLLQYRAGDYNCLHQDVYGEQVFPIQLAILLSRPNGDFTGGEFVMTEQRPRMQSRVMVVPLEQGDGVLFAVRNRPVQGTRGTYRVQLRHGVSRILSGTRHTLGIIFHDGE